jgi:DNA-binding Xre family transcriptional regulator
VIINLQDNGIVMQRLHLILMARRMKGASYKELAAKCNTTPKTMSSWIKRQPDLKWYSLLDICVGLEIELIDLVRGTKWEKLL